MLILSSAYTCRVVPKRIPLAPKVVSTAWAVVLVRPYWRHYGAGNFLWFSDLALFGLVPALWLEDARLTSMVAIWVVLPEIPWNLGFFTRLVTGRDRFGLTGYMFEKKNPLWIRALSLFHLWLPPLLVWSVRRLGYDRRALAPAIIAGETVLAASYAFTTPNENVNWVYGPGEKPQKKIPRRVYLGAVMLLFPLCVWWPAHRLLRRLR